MRIFQNYKKYAVVVALVISVSLFLTIKAPEIHKEYIVNSTSASVVKLLNPANHKSGGTGFVVETPSGALVTLTNAHVCRIGVNGRLDALIPGTDRYIELSIVEISKETDLCALMPVPGMSGLDLADSLRVHQTVAIVGHPKLQSMTMSMGEVTSFETTPVAIGTNLEETKCAELGGRTHSILGGLFTFCMRDYFTARTTATAFGGNSGSPVVNIYGNVVGVLFATDNDTNWGYIITLAEVREFLSIY